MTQEDAPSKDQPLLLGGDALVTLFADKRDNLLRFFTTRLGSREAAEQVVFQLGEAVTEGRLRTDGRDPVAALYKFGSELASQRRSPDTCKVEGAIEPTDSHRSAQLAEAIGLLPPDVRKVLRLHKFEHQSFRAIAEAMNLSVHQVEEHLRTALVHLVRSAPDRRR